jgi:hypothetical protein
MHDDATTTTGGIGRRDFLKLGGAATAGLLAGGIATEPARAGGAPPLPFNPRTQGAMPTRNLGGPATASASSAWAARPPSRSPTTRPWRCPSWSAPSTWA